MCLVSIVNGCVSAVYTPTFYANVFAYTSTPKPEMRRRFKFSCINLVLFFEMMAMCIAYAIQLIALLPDIALPAL